MENNTGKKYPAWIDEWAKAYHRAYVNMVPGSFGPIDLFDILPAVNDTFLRRLHLAVLESKQQGFTAKQIATTFSTLSSLRTAIMWLIFEYQFSKMKNKTEFRETLEFFMDTLRFWAKEDIFCLSSNIGHTKEEIREILHSALWQEGTPERARVIGRLYNSATSLGISLYRDFFHQEANEVYGPYDASSQYGVGSILLVKQCTKIRVPDLWPTTNNFQYSDIKILQIYKNVSFRCELAGVHSLYKGDLINGLVACCVIVDGKYVASLDEIKEISRYLAEQTVNHALLSEKLSQDQWQVKTLEWLAFEFNNFFALLKEDWRPTPEMLNTIKNKKFSTRHELIQFPAYREYVSSPHHPVYWLKDLYQ